MGDFNINLLNYVSHSSTGEFINTLATYCYQPHIIQPTRITDDHTATLIDHIYFNSIEHGTISGNLIYDISDHLPNFLIINNLTHTSYKQEIYRRDYSNYEEQNLIGEVREVIRESVLPDSYDANAKFD